MNIILFDHPEHAQHLYPITLTRPAAEIRVGILTLAEKWQKDLPATVSCLPESHLRVVYKTTYTGDNLYIAGNLIPDPEIVSAIKKLNREESLVTSTRSLAYRTGDFSDVQSFFDHLYNPPKKITYRGSPRFIDHLWDIFCLNGEEIINDLSRIKIGKGTIHDPHTRIYRPDQVFVQEGVNARAAIINAENGPVFLGKDVNIHEGAVIIGPTAILNGAEISIGAKIRENTTLGPYTKTGGEVKNSVILGFSNKAHDGFIGNSVIGEWCNLGADTNCSNLKNNYSNVKVYDFPSGKYLDSGLTFCGFFMGDHSKTGINTMINTGTVIGVSSNVFGSGFTPKYIASFCWGGVEEVSSYDFSKAMETVEKVMKRRNIKMTGPYRNLMQAIYGLTETDRIRQP